MESKDVDRSVSEPASEPAGTWVVVDTFVPSAEVLAEAVLLLEVSSGMYFVSLLCTVFPLESVAMAMLLPPAPLLLTQELELLELPLLPLMLRLD